MKHYLRFCVYFIVLLALLQLPPYAQSKTLLQTNTPSFVLADTFGLGTFSDAEVSPDGTFLAAAGTRGVWLFRTDNFNEPTAFFEVPGGIQHIAFDPTGNFLAGYALDGHIWNITSGQEVLSLYRREPHDALINSGEKIVKNLEFNFDGTLVAVETPNGIDVWNILNQDLVYEQNDQALVGFQSDKLLVHQYQDTVSLISIINISNWATETSFTLPPQTTGIWLSPDTETILAANFPVDASAQGSLGTNEGDLHILSAATGDDIATTSHYAIYRPHVAFNSGHPQIAFNTSEVPYIPGYIGAVQLWDFNSDEVLTISGYDSPVTTLAFSPDGLLLVTGQERGFETHQSVLRIWDTISGENVATSPALVESAVQVISVPMVPSYIPSIPMEF